MPDPLDFSKLLFARGYMLGTEELAVENKLLNDLIGWKCQTITGHSLHWHPAVAPLIERTQDRGVILIGNAVNPFTNEVEREVTSKIFRLFSSQSPSGRIAQQTIDYINQLTGRFRIFLIDESGPLAISDAAGLASIYFSQTGERAAFSSHSQLLAELVGAERDKNIQQIIDCRSFKLGRTNLPGYKSPFKGIELVGANVYYSTALKKRVRIFPLEPLNDTSRPLSDTIDESIEILRNTARIYMANRTLQFSLSLGQDSRINLSAFHPWRRQIRAHSYCGSPTETVEAYKVHEFSKRMNLEHEVISLDSVTESDCQDMSRTLARSTAYMRKHKSSEIRKLVAMSYWFPEGALEIKGEASEITRATYCKRIGIRQFPPMDVRVMTNLYKRILFPRYIVRSVDNYFEQFVYDAGFGFAALGYDDYDLFFWEHRNACGVSLGMQDHDIYRDSTSLMNNRLLLRNFLQAGLNDRIKDTMHRVVSERLWPGILDTPTSARTSVRARARILAERTFFYVNRMDARA